MSALIYLAIVFFLSTEVVINFFGKDANYTQNPDLIVILGCGNKIDKPLLNDRLEKALNAYLQYNIPILLTGDEKNKLEISSMHLYISKKAPTAKIITDPNSLTTWDSFLFIKNNFSDSKLLIITNEFHENRSLFFARMLKLKGKRFGKDLDFTQNIFLFLRERAARVYIYKHMLSKLASIQK